MRKEARPLSPYFSLLQKGGIISQPIRVTTSLCVYAFLSRMLAFMNLYRLVESLALTVQLLDQSLEPASTNFPGALRGSKQLAKVASHERMSDKRTSKDYQQVDRSVLLC